MITGLFSIENLNLKQELEFCEAYKKVFLQVFFVGGWRLLEVCVGVKEVIIEELLDVGDHFPAAID